jgi:hypothetical protein
VTALVLAWKWDTGSSTVQDFVYEGELSTLVKEVAAALDLIDGGKTLYEGIIGDLQGEVLRLKAANRELTETLDFWLERRPVGALA